jgi:hypothetical protein
MGMYDAIERLLNANIKQRSANMQLRNDFPFVTCFLVDVVFEQSDKANKK